MQLFNTQRLARLYRNLALDTLAYLRSQYIVGKGDIFTVYTNIKNKELYYPCKLVLETRGTNKLYCWQEKQTVVVTNLPKDKLKEVLPESVAYSKFDLWVPSHWATENFEHIITPWLRRKL